MFSKTDSGAESGQRDPTVRGQLQMKEIITLCTVFSVLKSTFGAHIRRCKVFFLSHGALLFRMQRWAQWNGRAEKPLISGKHVHGHLTAVRVNTCAVISEADVKRSWGDPTRRSGSVTLDAP